MSLNDDTSGWTLTDCTVVEFHKPSVISTGVGFFDHMIDQFYSHAQIGISILVDEKNRNIDDRKINDLETIAIQKESIEYINRHASCNQTELLQTVGTAIGTALRPLIASKCSKYGSQQTSTFGCPLDEALTICCIERRLSTASDSSGHLVTYSLPPYGNYPARIGRTRIGSLETTAIESFWKHVTVSSGLFISLTKVRGANGHHVVESSFKAFARALRNLLDNINTFDVANNDHSALSQMYGTESMNYKTSIDLDRHALIERNTKETSIRTELRFDGGKTGININTGIEKLNDFLRLMASNANISLHVACKGDLYIDEHHTAEDVAISIGQALNDALGDKAGLNRMWSSDNHTENCVLKVHVIMDLSNRPCLTHNLHTILCRMEMIDDLSCEMFEHVLESIVVNARMTVHIDVNGIDGYDNKDCTVNDVTMSIAHKFGKVLKYCSMVDSRRAGTTASSKGTLSV